MLFQLQVKTEVKLADQTLEWTAEQKRTPEVVLVGGKDGTATVHSTPRAKHTRRVRMQHAACRPC